MKSLIKNSLYNILYVLMNVVFPLVTTMYISRILLVEGIGKVAYAQTIASYFLTVASVGIPIYGIKAIASCGNDKEKTNEQFCELLYINVIVSVMSAIIYFVMIFTVDSFKMELSLYCACGLQIILNAFNIEWLFKGKEDYGLILIRSFIIKLLSFISVILFVNENSDYVMYALISSVALAGNHIWNLVCAKKYVQLRFTNLNLLRHIKPLAILLGTAILGTLYHKIDITMLGIMANERVVGLYSNAHKSINIILSATTAMTAVFLPRLSSLYYNSEKKELQSALHMGMDILSLFCIPACVGLYILAPQLTVLLYGEAFRAVAISLRLFVPLILINSYGDLFCYQLIIASGNENKRLLVNFMGVLINIGLNAVLIPRFYEKGATIASVLSEFVINVLLFIYIKKTIGFSVSMKSAIKSLLAAIGMGIVVYAITALGLSNFVTCIMGIAVGLLTYFAFNLLISNEILTHCFRKVIKR